MKIKILQKIGKLRKWSPRCGRHEVVATRKAGFARSQFKRLEGALLLIRRPAMLLFPSHQPVILTKMPNSMLKRLIANKLVVFQKALRSLLWIVVVISTSACASHYGAAKIVSSPPGAQVISAGDGSVIGTTPMTYRWKNANGNRETIIVKLKKAGYYEKTSSFWLDMRARNLRTALAAPHLVEIEMQKIGE